MKKPQYLYTQDTMEEHPDNTIPKVKTTRANTNILQSEKKAKGNKIDNKNRLTKYTNRGLRHNGTRKGWSLSGLKRFNTIFKAIKLEREREASKTREVQLLDEYKAGDNDGRSHNRGDEDMSEDEAAEQEVFVSESDFNYE